MKTGCSLLEISDLWSQKVSVADTLFIAITSRVASDDTLDFLDCLWFYIMKRLAGRPLKSPCSRVLSCSESFVTKKNEKKLELVF